jgi:hypothetical protein
MGSLLNLGLDGGESNALDLDKELVGARSVSVGRANRHLFGGGGNPRSLVSHDWRMFLDGVLGGVVCR